MGVGQSGQGRIALGKICQQLHGAQQLFVQKRQRVAHDKKVGVVAHIAAGGPQVNDALRAWALQAIGVHMAHHIVAALRLAAHGVLVVHIIDMGLQLGYLPVGDGKALGLLGLGQGHPQPAPGAELVLFRKQVLHLAAGIAGGKRALVNIARHIGVLLSMATKGWRPAGQGRAKTEKGATGPLPTAPLPC